MTDTHTTSHIPDEAVQAAVMAYSKQMDYNDNHVDAVKASITAALPHLQLGYKVKFLSASDAAHHHREKNKKLRKRNRALLTALREVVASKTLHDANFIANIAIAGWEDDELIHKARSVTNVRTKPVDVAAVREKVAREICLSYGQDPDDYASLCDVCGPNNEPRPQWHMYTEQAEAAIRALSAEPAQGEQLKCIGYMDYFSMTAIKHGADFSSVTISKDKSGTHTYSIYAALAQEAGE